MPHSNLTFTIANQLENTGSNTWKLSLIRESNDNFQCSVKFHQKTH
ncbi:MAG: hypothetical protein LC437_10040 [Thiohalomonas sp.]|nr:hypothetical protein [Thiohalomonas sp.]